MRDPIGISITVAQLSRFLENAGQNHWDAGIRVDLLKTKDVGITYDGQQGTEVVAYSDVDWAGNRDDRRSTGGIMLMMCGAPVVWRSSFQKTVALTSTETEYMALSDYVKEMVWIRLLHDLLGQPRAMALAKNVGYQARTKHIDIRYHFIHTKAASGEVELGVRGYQEPAR
ncbi:hypothetical protein PC129_g20769 [Phytophthora cactorum]|uniref:Reverse transcriptase Ty1/copia-type domain-containing protein n=1 Tax=Phytophthora cactorum TaxID=29920 RepID=A0A329RM22_9STRA|nr:hypothetical protein Pcac1_g27876 [Phytophthora cactorum]KAG2798357.1 hypothetical protein PC112_g21384 [Phytophthora cactorum]KAG2798386.1 hypothetical protein PC111_g20871 [Phytophthora cactorum]KAG2829279.1 hypothetical protein PC113_g21308 [Phytophthora cactorum]KAG2877372.1 hypothetical protein PC114_g23666 [Phytophthora cactorum]